jgi:hypothetical protein
VPKFPWSRPTLAVPNCVFNLVPGADEFEKEFACFLRDAADVERFAKLPERFSFAIEYTDAVGNLRYYESDSVAAVAGGVHHLLETKGLEDVNVAFKDRATRLWCENAPRLVTKVGTEAVRFARGLCPALACHGGARVSNRSLMAVRASSQSSGFWRTRTTPSDSAARGADS